LFFFIGIYVLLVPLILKRAFLVYFSWSCYLKNVTFVLEKEDPWITDAIDLLDDRDFL